MRIQFVNRAGAPEKLICEAEVVFDDGPFAGMKLVGFSLWRGGDDGVFVTFPARAFGPEGERRYFDLLRSAEGNPADPRRVKEWILESYRSATIAA
jgi:hypothetical protein